MKRKKIVILDSTGSIGINTLKLIESNYLNFKVLALTAGKNINLLKKQIDIFNPKVVAVINEFYAKNFKKKGLTTKTEILWGEESYQQIAVLKEADFVICAIVGSGGLIPTIKAIEAGTDIALTNKEILVIAEKIIINKIKENGINCFPLDSEHYAIYQCLQGKKYKDLKKIILTASGGPFLYKNTQEMLNISIEDVLKHPTWKMGEKISIDSASMMNKGLEIIEAKWLFNLNLNQIEIVIHPQSVIYSMVKFIDYSIIAQLSSLTMFIPITYALNYPQKAKISNNLSLNFLQKLIFEFFPPDFNQFPCINLAYTAAKIGGTLETVLNAANEIAVQAFLEKKIDFLKIPIIIKATMIKHTQKSIQTIDDVLLADCWARKTASDFIEKRYIKNDI